MLFEATREAYWAGGYNTHHLSVAWWRHPMEAFFALLTLCAWKSPVTDVFFICVWINSWTNNRGAGDLSRYRAYHDVIVMDKMKKNKYDAG